MQVERNCSRTSTIRHADLFIESRIRVWVSMISGRQAVANNQYVPDYDPTKSSTHITYLDANNLSGCAMSLPLPVSNFRWLDRERIDTLDVTAVDDDADTGYILEVDLEYPSQPPQRLPSGPEETVPSPTTCSPSTPDIYTPSWVVVCPRPEPS